MASCQELADTDVARAGDFSSRGASARSAARRRTNAADDAPRGGCEAKVSQHHKDCPALVGASSSLTSQAGRSCVAAMMSRGCLIVESEKVMQARASIFRYARA